MKRYYSFLAEIPLFQNINYTDIDPMLKCIGGYTAEYKKGNFISISGYAINYIGVIIKGAVHMLKEDAWGNKYLFSIMREKEIFGETFICSKTSVATVSFFAETDCTILLLPSDKLVSTCTKSCDFHHKLIENLVLLTAKKNFQLMEKLDIVTKKTLREKILTYLYQQYLIYKDINFTIPMGRLELADYLCVNRSALTRELSNMKKDGLLDYDKNTFRLLNIYN